MQGLQTAVQAVEQGELDPFNPEQLRRLLWQQINSLPNLSFITFASEQGQEIGYGRIQNQALKRQVDKHLSLPITLNAPFLVQRSGPDWLNRRFYLVDRQGKPTQAIYSLRQDTRRFIWYQEARQRQRIYWSSVHVNYVVPSLHIAATAPLFDTQGRLQGVFSIPFPLSDLNTFIHELNFSPSGQAFVLDQTGHLLTTPDDEPLFQPFQANQGKVTPTVLKATESRHPWIKAIAEELQRNHSQAIKEDSNIHLHFPLTVQGAKLFVDVQRYRDDYGLNWLLVVVIPESDFMREIQANQRLTGLFMFLSLILGTAISLWVARLILRPLTQLTQASGALAQRQSPNPTLPHSPVRELNDLAASFNQMAQDIEVSQTQLQSQNHQLQQFLNAIPFGIRIIDPQGQLHYANQQAIALTDTSLVSTNARGEFVLSPHVFTAGTITPYALEQFPLIKALQGVASYTEDIDYHHNGTIIPMAVWGTPIYNAAGALEYGMVVFQDISERKQIEHRIQQANVELQQANRLKDEFFAVMSHELRTPLNAILGIAEGLQEEIFGPLTEQQHKSLKIIENSGYHLLNLINDILDLSSINAGKFQLDLVLTPIAPICQDGLTFVEAQAHRKQIQLELRLPSVLPQLLVDERRLRQCLINLLSNAVKFTPEGGHVSLTVSLPASQGSLAGTVSYVRFQVIDTGIGIAPEHLGRLFQPFSQIDSQLNRQYEGTGLGLSLVKRMVELQGGAVGVSSELGIGSCFWIDIPCPEGMPVLPTVETQSA